MSWEHMVYEQINQIDEAIYYFEQKEIDRLRDEIGGIPTGATGVVAVWEVEPKPEHDTIGILKWAKATTSSNPRHRYAAYEDL